MPRINESLQYFGVRPIRILFFSVENVDSATASVSATQAVLSKESSLFFGSNHSQGQSAVQFQSQKSETNIDTDPG